VIAGARILSEREDVCPGDSMDFFGAGKIMEGAGDTGKSVEFFQRALEGKLTEEISLKTKKKLSFHFKRNQEWEKAIPFWEDIVTSETVTSTHLFSFRELAMYYEHKKKDFEQARKIAEEGYVLSRNVSSYYEEDFSYRLERLKRKIKSKKNKDT
jgi:hypothetical protein